MLLLTGAAIASIIGSYALSYAVPPIPRASGPSTPEVLLAPLAPSSNPSTCAWASDPFQGMAANPNLVLQEACGKVRGAVKQIVVEVKGERTTCHFTLLPDPEYAALVNAENGAQLDGALMN